MSKILFTRFGQHLLVCLVAAVTCGMPASVHAADCLTPPAGMVGWWPGNGNAGDQTGSGASQIQGYATFAPGKVGHAFSFTGNGAVVVDSPALNFASNSTLTVELWAYRTGSASVMHLLGKRAGCSGTGMQYQLAFDANNGLAFGGDGGSVATGVQLPLNTWKHLAITVQGSNFVFYIDGLPVRTNAASIGPVVDQPLKIGGSGDCAGFVGMLDEVTFYNRALSATEIAALYAVDAAGKCGATSTMAAVPYFADFEDGVGVEWSVPRRETSEPTRFSSFLGRFGNTAQTLSLSGLTPGQSYTVGFDLYVADSWDGGNTTSGDNIYVAVNGITIFRESFNNFGGQTYGANPDEGREQMGFNNGYPDAIYRNVELNFTASNSTASITFGGANLEDLGNESWGLDNISVQPAVSNAATFVRSVSIPRGTNAIAMDTFTVGASRPLQATTATNLANWSLREAGPNGALGDGDDINIGLTAALAPVHYTGRSVLFTIPNGPLQPGRYRFQSGAGLLDTNGVAVVSLTRDFVIAHPVMGRVETLDNGTIAGASSLPVVETPAGSGFLTAYGVGTFSASGDVDYWRFDAEAGDRLTVRLETRGEGTYPQCYLQNVSGGNLTTAGGNYEGVVGFQQYQFTAPGTYYLRVWNDRRAVPYSLRLDIGRGTQIESEGNNSIAAANSLNLTIAPGLSQARVAGTLPYDDAAGDYFSLLTLNTGNAISINARFPEGSTLDASKLLLQVLAAGSSAVMAANSGANLNFTVPSNAVYYVRAYASGGNIRHQYLLDVAVNDGVPPVIAGSSLPDQGGGTGIVFDRFTLNFSEEIHPPSVTNSAHYELRGAGPDGVFNENDQFYSVVADGYSSGLSADFTLSDGPLQPGLVRLTVRTNLIDRVGNAMAAPFVRTFTITNFPGYVLESRGNNVPGTAGYFSSAPSVTADGTFSYSGNFGAGNGPHYMALGQFSGDTNIDIAVANYLGDSVALMTGSGDGTFVRATNLAVGSRPVAVAVGRFNNDAEDDLAVANYNGQSVSILLSTPAGYALTTNLTGFSAPYQLITGDLNGDGRADLVVPNYSGSSIRVLLGNGDGTFMPGTNYSTPGNPMHVAIGNINGDTVPDLAVACYSGSVSWFIGLSNGIFQAAQSLPAGANTRSVAIADVTGDGIVDLVTISAHEGSVNVFRGLGNGSFENRRDYANGTGDAYQLALGHFNGDTALDIVVPGYSSDNFGVLLNDGAGNFTNLVVYGLNQYPLGVVVGDFDRDGRADLVFSRYSGDALAVFRGNALAVFAEDPAGSAMRSGFIRGQLANNSDVDYYRFSGVAGDQAVVAIEVPNAPPGSGLNVRLQRADGGDLTTFNAPDRGFSQSGVVTLPYTGTYLVRVSSNYDYRGEYRVRVTMNRPLTQFESEDNNSIANANVPNFRLTNGHLAATLAGYLSRNDGAGDYFNLGILAGGATVTLNLREPASSGFAGIISLFDGAGQLVTNSAAGFTNFTFTVPASGPYFARLTADPSAPAFSLGGSTEFALLFDGADDYLQATNSPTLRPVNLTLEAWVNFSAISGVHTVIAKGLGTGDDDSYVLWYNQGQLRGYISGGPTLGYNWTPEFGRWYHVAYTFDDAANIHILYLDGVPVATGVNNASINYDTRPVQIGADVVSDAPNYFFPGKIDEVRIWNVVRAPAEIDAVKSQRLAGNEQGLAAYWRLDEGTGLVAADATGNSNLAVLVNYPVWAASTVNTFSGMALAAQYLLSLDIIDNSPLQVVGLNLPDEGSTVSNIWQRFSVQFNEELDRRLTQMNRRVLNYGASKYQVTDGTMSWTEAEAYAVSLGGHLVALNSADENTWVWQNFSRYGDVWIGFNDRTAEGTFEWSSGQPATYTAWYSSQPDNYNTADAVWLDDGGGQWFDDPASGARRAVMEFAATPDTDNDGLPNGVDLYPTDARNGLELRSAGANGLFDDGDDYVYDLDAAAYAGGTNLSLIVVDGPLQYGLHRFTVSTAFTDRFGNGLTAPFTRTFTVAPVSNFVLEDRGNDSRDAATSLSPEFGAFDGSFGPAITNITLGQTPHYILATNLNADIHLDLLVANYGSDTVSVLLGQQNGTFQVLTNVPVGDGPIGIVTTDLNGDAKLDFTVCNYNANTLGVYLGDGVGGFVNLTNYATPSRPYYAVQGDFNKDGKTDLVTGNINGGNISVFLGNGDGTFQARTDIGTGSGAYSLAAVDLNADTFLDVVVANRNAQTISVLLGKGDGTFHGATNYATTTTAGGLTVGDLNGDGWLDVAAMSGDSLNFFRGNGDGTLGPRTTFSYGTYDVYELDLLDLDGNGTLDLVISDYGSSRLLTAPNNGDGTFGAALAYGLGGQPISAAAGDFDHDGRVDLALAMYNRNTVQILRGAGAQSLALDAVTGLRIGGGRGALFDDNDNDYWTFSARVNDRLTLATENPGIPGSSGLRFLIYRPDGSQMADFYPGANSVGEYSAVLSSAGTYSIRVLPWHSYYGEYRFRITLAPPPLQYETEENNSVSSADPVTLTLNNGRQIASLYGYISWGDPGDYFRLGNLSEGTAITISQSRPGTSRLEPRLSIYNAAGTLVTNGLPGQSNLTFVVQAGEAGAYYARVEGSWAGRGGVDGQALLMDGSNDYVNTGGWSPGKVWTVQAWVMANSLPSGRRGIAGSWNSCQDWGLAQSDGRWAMSIRPFGGACSQTVTAPDAVVPGMWYHLLASCDGTNSFLYVNGSLVGTAPVATDYSPTASGTWFGAEPCCGSYFPGLIQRVGIWNRAVKAEEVAGLMTTNLAGTEAGLVGYWPINEGAGATTADLSTSARLGTLVNGPTWVMLGSPSAMNWGLFAEYRLELQLADTSPPFITGTTLPTEGAQSGDLIDRFNVTFSEDLARSTVTNSANYELRHAGLDGQFGTADDAFYTVLNSPFYNSGLSAAYLVSDGPLQAGAYRFTVFTNITDTSGSLLASNFVRYFAVTNLPGMIAESRNNGSRNLATSLSIAPVAGPDGSLSSGAVVPLPVDPEYVAIGHLNNDTNLDLVIPSYGNSTISVYLGNGDGTFQLRTNFAGSAGGLMPVLAHFNNDGVLDLAVGDYTANTVTIYLGSGGGEFSRYTNYSVAARPVGMISADFNNDSRADLAAVCYNGNSLAVLLGDGSGAFLVSSNYAIPSNPHGLACGDFNADGRLDLVTANYGSDNLTLLAGNGNGTFALAGNLAVNNAPRHVAVADLNGDQKLDLVSANYDSTVSVLFGNGNGTFQPRVNYGTGGQNQYYVLPADLNADGWLDLAVTGFDSDRVGVLLNRGNGQFEGAASYATYNQPIGMAAGDFNQDRRADLVVVHYGADNFMLLLGNDTEPLASDDAEGLVFTGRGRGNLYNNSDADFWSFTAAAGDILHISIFNPGSPANSSRLIEVYDPDGSRIDYFYSDYYGWGSWSSGNLAMGGTYSLRVTMSDNYTGEYRFAVWTLKAPLQADREDNDSYSQANSLVFNTQAGSQTARVFGTALTDADFYRLGNLAAGTTVQMTLVRPVSSQFSGSLSIYKGSALVTNTPVDPTGLVYVIPDGEGDNYYARVISSGTGNLLSCYILTIALSDYTPPAITGISLPAAGSSSSALWDSVTLNFNKDLDPGIAQIGQNIRTRNGHAYFLTGSQTWLAAAQQAVARGGYLAVINDVAENDWVVANFSGTYWIGLTDESQEGVFTWMNGEPFAFTNWNSGQPDNSGNEDYAAIISNGKWQDYGLGSSYAGLMEVVGIDTDGDGIPDSVDPFPADALNLFDLRASGPDLTFDTADDEVYRLVPGSYSSGLTLTLSVVDGPLQPGTYRFRTTTALRDLFGNSAPFAFDRFFSIGNLPPFKVENRDNGTAATATALEFVENPPGLRTAYGRGKLYDNNDADFWSFNASAGDIMSFATETPGRPGASELRYEVLNPAGIRILDFYPGYYGSGQAPAVTLTNTGSFRVRVTYSYSYRGEYRFRVTLATPPIMAENENNDTLATANTVTLAESGNSRFASLLGSAKSPADLDYFNLGTLTNGSSIFLSVRLPNGSTYVPVISVYNAANQYQAEAGAGSSGDGVAEVRITSTGNYYALVRGSSSAEDLQAQYVLDIQVVPTGTVSFPNLVVSSVTLPAGTPLSGQTVSYQYNVANVGALATPVSSWLDRAAFSTNTILGDADDIPLGFFAHSGAVDSGAGYSVTNTFILPEGVSGDYYLIVQADAGNAVNEFVFEVDNMLVSPGTFRINRAPYPDIKIEGLTLIGPTGAGNYTINWTTANRGNAPVAGSFRERFAVRNLTTGQSLVSEESTIPAGLAVNGTVPRSGGITTTNPGNYQIEITTDVLNQIYEFDVVSHASAEQNTAVTNFAITQMFAVTVTPNPAGAGLVTGGGNYASGTQVSVNAQAITNELPYFFVSWTEGGVFQSASTNYTFTVTRARPLVANFSLPAYVIAASNNPPAGGTVTGQGTYFHGATNVLVAQPNAGYLFTNWTENGQVVSTLAAYTNVVTSNRLVVANYHEANTFHAVSVATAPSGLASLSGAGVYFNGQSGQFSAPVSITNPPFVYSFREWRGNGALAATTPSFTKLFSTLDPTNLQYVAHYDSTTILPVITNVLVSITNPVPATTNFVLTLQFNRSMRSAPEPLVVLTNPSVTVQATVPVGGTWSTRAVSNDTYSTPPVSFSAGMDGTNLVWVSQAQDLGGFAVTLTNVGLVVVDVTPPIHPVLTLTSSNNTSATVSWNTYAAPADLSGFRVYLSTNSFNSVTGLSLITRLNASARSYTYSGIELDRNYYAAIAAVDVAGNSPTSVTPFQFRLPSSVPPPVAIQVAALEGTSAQVSWNSYSTANLLGFAGFRLFFEETNFTSVAGLTARQTLAPGARTAVIASLDRTRNYYFAVVGYNVNNAFTPGVTTARWSDPFAGSIGANLTMGGSGQVLDIYQSITVVSNAVLTIPAGTALRFAPGTGLNIQNGRLMAQGTALDPITFTSAADQPGGTPVAGEWNGLLLGTNAGASVLRHVWVKYGAGLTLDGCSPTVDAFTAINNTPAGLRLKNGARLTTADALVLYNGVGLHQTDTAQLVIRNSVIKNNLTNGWSAGTLGLIATQNWWGSPVAAEIDTLLAGQVDRSAFLADEPLLTPAVGMSNNVTQVGSRQVTLKLACRTAEAARLSEDSTFPTAFYQAFSAYTGFQLSEGGGQKTIYAQYRSLTGETSAPVSVTVTYITDGPRITSFSLTEGQALSRPLVVTGSATAPLGMSAMEFYVNNVLQGSSTGGSFSAPFDVRLFSNGIYRVKLLARDTSGNFATLERNVSFAPTPPPAPVITTPASDITVSGSSINVAGAAEPQVEVRLSRDGTIVGTTFAGANGAFNFANVPLVEGANALVATAVDSVGSARSPIRVVVLDSGPPAQLVMDPPTYRPGVGLGLTWRYPAEGERATRYRVFWHTAYFTTTNEATGRSVLLQNMDYDLYGLANTTYYFAVIGYDSAGNASPLSEVVTYSYDSQPPVMNVSFDKPSPVGTGKLRIVLTASEPLSETPRLTIRPFNSSPQMLTLSNAALNTYEAFLNVTPGTASGRATLNVAAIDLARNVFNGTPVGSDLTIDVTPPSGMVITAPAAPVQVTNLAMVAVNLVLTEAAKPSVAPTLNFVPPSGAPVVLSLTGSGTNWNGSLPLNPSMGSGHGLFLLTVRDNLDNEGHQITSGSQLEIYNTMLPAPPAPPANFQGTLLPGGAVRLTWNSVSNAEMYQLYSEPGSNGVPAVLVASGITNTVITNVPPTEGFYRFAVTASRRGSESTNSDVVIAFCDRTPPPPATNLVVELVAAGVQITWQKSPGENPHHYNIYRNGTVIRSLAGIVPVIDVPPRGVITYRVAAADQTGNEAFSEPATIELQVGPVNNLQVLVTPGQAPVLTWAGSDPAAAIYNVYRNGIKQNAAPIAALTFTDTLPVGGDVVQYAVRAVNASNQESLPRTVAVYPVALNLLANNAGGAASGSLVLGYFDQYTISLTNLATNAALLLREIELRRSGGGADPRTTLARLDTSVGAGQSLSRNVVFPGARTLAPQTVHARAIQETDIGGSSVIYQASYEFTEVANPGVTMEITANQLPLAGGLAEFEVEVFNRGYADMDFVVASGRGANPGELYVSVKDPQGQEVSRGYFLGTPAGTRFTGDGRGYLTLSPGNSVRLTVPGILVPESLSSNALITFEAALDQVYYHIGAADQLVAGPLRGSMRSALTQTEYYGVAQTDRTSYPNTVPVIITGQAIQRNTGQPVPNASLKIGFATRGFNWDVPVVTDASGNFRYEYNAPPGLSGTLSIWAAHPDIYDVLNQARITLFRIYATPARGDIRMSKNDTLQFSISLINPGDVPLTGFTAAAQLFQMQGTNRVPITSITGGVDMPQDFTVGPGETKRVNFHLTSTLDAPDNAVAEFRIESAEGAAADFAANLTLLPAVPVLAVVNPGVGYLEASVDRGAVLSRQITVANRGLRDLQGVELIPPTNLTWLVPNLPLSPDGKIRLPDIPVGGSNTFTVVFSPPADVPLGQTNDYLLIKGTNAQTPFRINLYPMITSNKKGAAQFYVDNVLGLPVPDATIRLRSTALQVEIPPVKTDANGYVTVPDLQEGYWSWLITAPGHSSAVGVVEVIPSQTVLVEPPATRLNKSLVTITFRVEPVPFTDRYEIKIEQTFETHVPIPVLVLTPPALEFHDVQPGFEANFVVKAKNHGLIEMFDVKVTGMDAPSGRLEPLITFFPVLRPFEEVEIPFRLAYYGSEAGQQGMQARQLGGFPVGCGGGDLPSLADTLAGMNAMVQGNSLCAAGGALLAIAQGLLIALYLWQTQVNKMYKYAYKLATLLTCLGIFSSSGGGGGNSGGGGGGPSSGSSGGWGLGGAICFAPGTQITMADGSTKPIELIQTNDVVRCGQTRREAAAVVETMETEVDQLRVIRYRLEDGSQTERTVQTTDDHLFWRDGGGWTAARELVQGQWLTTERGQRATVVANEVVRQKTKVYTFKTREDHVFYANGVLVHDQCGDLNTTATVSNR